MDYTTNNFCYRPTDSQIEEIFKSNFLIWLVEKSFYPNIGWEFCLGNIQELKTNILTKVINLIINEPLTRQIWFEVGSTDLKSTITEYRDSSWRLNINSEKVKILIRDIKLKKLLIKNEE